MLLILLHLELVFSQLRMSSNRLCFETGGWHMPYQTPISEGICNVCSTLEDEYHFVLECSLYLSVWKTKYHQFTGKDLVCLNSNNACLLQKTSCSLIMLLKYAPILCIYEPDIFFIFWCSVVFLLLCIILCIVLPSAICVCKYCKLAAYMSVYAIVVINIQQTVITSPIFWAT